MWRKLQALGKTVKVKILLVLLAFCLVFLSIFSIFYLRTTQALSARILASYHDMLSMYVGQLNAQILDIENYLYNLSTDFDVNTMAIRSPGTDDYVLTKFRVFNNTLQAYSTYNMLDAVYFHDQRNDSLLMIPSDVKRYEAIARAAVKQAAEADENRWNLYWYGDSHLLAKQKRVSDSLAVVFFICVEDLVQTMKTMTEGSDYELLVSSSTNESVYESVPGLAEGSAGAYHRIDKSLDLTGLQFHLLVHDGSIQAELSFYTSFFLLSVALLTVIVILVLYALRRHLLTPLDNLIVGMREFAGGNENIRLKRIGSTELAFAIDTFNDMVYQIKNNRILIYEDQLEKQKLLIQNLQAQIDPHFFSNTMNLLYNLIAVNEIETSKKCLLHLSEYYRHITRISQQQILLEEEINFIRAYLEIMSLRFPGKMAASVHMSEALRDLQIPPLLVQPLVENCIKHGFTDRNCEFYLHVDADVQNDCAVIAVMDSGIGFPTVYCGVYDKNREFPASAENRDNHVGIRNIYQRLIMVFGADAKMSIQQNDGLAQVEILIHNWRRYR